MLKFRTLSKIKTNIFLLPLLLFSGCISFNSKNIPSTGDSLIKLGALNSKKTWIYLCGLTQDFDSEQEIKNRESLNQIGTELNIRFVAVKPESRCHEFDNKLCWPHNSDKETLKTYNFILDTTKNIHITGLIGFSNGGFFLNKLIQIIELNKPIISIGSAGYLANTRLKNDLYLLIGGEDIHHYNGAMKFYDKSVGTQLNVRLIKHDDGHEIPKQILKDLLEKIG